MQMSVVGKKARNLVKTCDSLVQNLVKAYKQIMDEVLVISGIIKVEVGVPLG